MATILQNLPAEAEITRVEYEGPRIALYTKKPKFLYQNNYVISDIVNLVKKRVVVRTDKSIRRTEEEAREIISNAVSAEAGLQQMFFDDALGEAIVEIRKPQLLGPDKDSSTADLVEKTGWRIKVRKASPIASNTLQTIYHTFKTGADDRERFLREAGDRIFRGKLSSDPEITIHTLGAFNEVGRSAVLVTTPESKILMDCGIHPGQKYSWDAYPRLDWADLDFDDLDAAIVSHAHMDHHAFLPALYKYGYDGPIYATEPTLPLMTLLQQDFVKIASIGGGNMLYDMKDVREAIKHTITLPYGLVTDVSPDVKLVLNNAGHILGSSILHLHIGDGAHNIIYTGDFKYAPTMLLDPATANFPRAETLIMESTYGAKEDIMPNRDEVEMNLVNTVNKTLSEGGKVLIPSPAVGRSQEIMLVLNQYMKNRSLVECPIFLEGMISEATAIHMSYPEYLERELRSQILDTDENPFRSEYFTNIEHASNREEALREGPAIIMATSGMLEGGPVMEYLENVAPSEKNKILFVSYQISGTLGRRVLDGARQINLPQDGGKIKIADMKCAVEKIEGFSGHSDYNQLIRFVARLRPKLKHVIINHGERRKVENVTNAVSRMFRLPASGPDVMEAIRLR
ncbi:MAG: beta-CASP ribonuclease aCPSF1 [Thaumarchaeota archaeon]|nr:beta-CASP ribonuclease aCPSF1 [Nitrososphaerota archaeon]